MSRLKEKLATWMFSPDYLNISPSQFVKLTMIVFLLMGVSPALVPFIPEFFIRSAIAFLVGVLGLTYGFLFILPSGARWLWSLVVVMSCLSMLPFPQSSPMDSEKASELEYLLLTIMFWGLFFISLSLLGYIELIRSSEVRAWFNQVNVLHQEAKRCTGYSVHEALTKYEQLLEAYVQGPIERLFGDMAFSHWNVLSILLWIADKDSQRALDCIFHLTMAVESEGRSVEEALEATQPPKTHHLSRVLHHIEQMLDAMFDALVNILRDTDTSPCRAFLSFAEAASTATLIDWFCWKVERTGTLRGRDALLKICEAYIPLLGAVGLEEFIEKAEKTQWRKAAEFLRLVPMPEPEQEEQPEDAWQEALEKLTALQQMECGQEVAALYSIVACLARLQSPLVPEEIRKCMDDEELKVLRGKERLPLKDKVQVLEQLKQVAENWTRCEQKSSSVGRRSCYADVREELDKIRPLVLTGPSGVLLGRIVKQCRDEVDQRITTPKFVSGRGINPYIVGDVIREPDMFFGREELLKRITNTLHNNSIMIHGPRRIGKTSLLYQLAARLRATSDPDYAFIPAFIDLEGTAQEEFFHTLMEEILEDCQPYLTKRLSLVYNEKSERTYTDRDFARDLSTLIDHLQQNSDKEVRLILLLDEVDVMNRYDQLVQQQLRRIFMKTFARNLGAVVAGVHISKEWDRLESPWYNLFLEMELPPLSHEEAVRLIKEPVKGVYGYEDEAVEAIWEYSQGHPQLVQQLCLEAVNRLLQEKRSWVTKADVESVYREIVAPEKAQEEREERERARPLVKRVAEDGPAYEAEEGADVQRGDG